jgi:hypothetical protein
MRNKLTGECSQIGIEFRFTKTTRADRSRRIRDLLDLRHRGNPCLDTAEKGSITAGDVAVYNILVDQGGIANPHVPVVRACCKIIGVRFGYIQEESEREASILICAPHHMVLGTIGRVTHI